MIFQSFYVRKYKSCKIKDDTALFESRHGSDLGSNILRLLVETKRLYGDKFKLFVTCEKEKKAEISAILKRYDVKDVKLVSPKSLKYLTLLASVKYLFNDTTFTPRYIKKEGQIVTNTWHGTPLKYMGRDDALGVYSMGNVQRNLYFSDFLIFPNEYMKAKMTWAYSLDKAFKGSVLKVGYPRNTLFFKSPDEFLRKSLGLADKKLYVYMPTWRGSLDRMKNSVQVEEIKNYLSELDKRMTEKEILLAKLHPFVLENVDFSGFSHIKSFPEGYDSYEVLNLADCLITDYSSVFFDFAITKRKIILFAYDMESYLSERGVYTQLSDLPFPVVNDVEGLYAEMQSGKNYDDSEFLEQCCTYESEDACEKILSRVFENKPCCEEEKIYDGTKKNVLVFSGNLAKNGITSALVSLLSRVDTSQRRFFVTFNQQSVKSEPERALLIPQNAEIFPMPTKPQYTVSEALAQGLLYKLKIGSKWVFKTIDNMCRREFERFFGCIDVDFVVQFEGYGKNMLHLFKNAPCKRAIFVHNNMLEEMKNKDIQQRVTLENCYKSYDFIACVTEDLVESTGEIAGDTARIRVVSNCHDYKKVLEKADKEISFDEDTVSMVSRDKLCEILDSNAKKLITIGRFSREKGHDLLIKAFEKAYEVQKDSYLIIIGGYGELFESTLELAKNSKARENIIVIYSVSNPMPILKRCDLFLLSSRYEGLGLTLLEAETLKIPCISTNVCGPSGFMKRYGGRLVDCSVQGILEGITDFFDGKISTMNVDFEEYNLNVVREFEGLLGG